MRLLKIACGLAAAVILLSGCGGGSDPSSTASSDNPATSTSPPATTSPAQTGSSTSGSTSSGSTSGSGSGSGTGTGTATTGKATVSWTAPTQNTDGTPLTLSDIQGYYVYYGTSATSLTNKVQLQGSGTLTYTVTGLTNGTWYFAVAAATSEGQSTNSPVVSTTIS